MNFSSLNSNRMGLWHVFVHAEVVTLTPYNWIENLVASSANERDLTYNGGSTEAKLAPLTTFQNSKTRKAGSGINYKCFQNISWGQFFSSNKVFLTWARWAYFSTLKDYCARTTTTSEPGFYIWKKGRDMTQMFCRAPHTCLQSKWGVDDSCGPNILGSKQETRGNIGHLGPLSSCQSR